MANLPSDVLMYVYVLGKVATNPPVPTLIHSCDGNASVVLGQASGLKSAADQYGSALAPAPFTYAPGILGKEEGSV